MVKKNKGLPAGRQALEEAINNWKRAVADYQNLEKRMIGERANLIKTANRSLLSRLLPVLDTLMLARNHIKNEGLELAARQFIEVLRVENVEQIETTNQEFDPNLMECVDTVEGQENRVVSQIRAGFKFKNGEVLRPAQVRVGKSNVVKEEYV